MKQGSVGILSVGAGDIKLSFDRDDPQECIRAARMVTSMLRSGYALMVEVEEGGVKKYRRVYEFNADTYEYIIADLDAAVPSHPAEIIATSTADSQKEQANVETEQNAAPRAQKDKPRRRTRAVEASAARAVAIAHRAGG